MRRSIAVSTLLSAAFTVLLTAVCCLLAHPVLDWMQVPEEIETQAYDYMFIVLLGTGATVFYNMVSNILRALGDSRTPLYFLMLSSVLNVILDVLFIVPLRMGVAGAAWATVLAQLLSGLLSLLVGWRRFPVMHLVRADFRDLRPEAAAHLKIGFTMGFQMSVMCIGQLAMQAAVNSLGTAAVAGYTAATKADQVSVLINNAMMTAVSNYVAQNYGAVQPARIRAGVRAALLQTETLNLLMCAGILLLRHPLVRLFLTEPGAEIYRYSDGYLLGVAPFYVILGLLAVYRTSIQSMQNGWAPFTACMIELVMRIAATGVLFRAMGYTAVCLASPLAWFGAWCAADSGLLPHDAPAQRSRVIRRPVECLQIGLRLSAAAEAVDFQLIFILRQQRVDAREPLFPEVLDELPELRVKFVLDPGHVRPMCPDPGRGPGKADLCREVHQEDCVAGGQPQRNRPGIVPVDNPALLTENLVQPPVELRTGHGAPVGEMIQHVQIEQGQPGACLQGPGEGALSGPRGADDNHSLHGNPAFLCRFPYHI